MAEPFQSVNNTTDVPLGISGVFTGLPDDTAGYATAVVSVYTDALCATAGVSIQQSYNGENWDEIETHDIQRNTFTPFVVPLKARYLRVIYTNSTTIQTVFHLQTLYFVAAVTPSIPVSERPFGFVGQTTTATTQDYSGRTRRMVLFIDMDNAGTGSISPQLQIYNTALQDYVTIWQAPAITVTGNYSYYFADGASGGANSSWTDVVPFGTPSRRFRFRMIANNANPTDYRVAIDFLPN